MRPQRDAEGLGRVLPDSQINGAVTAAMFGILERVAMNITINACFRDLEEGTTRKMMLESGRNELKALKVNLPSRLSLRMLQLEKDNGNVVPPTE